MALLVQSQKSELLLEDQSLPGIPAPPADPADHKQGMLDQL